MKNPPFLSRFTPSLMTPEVLERIFVQRGDLAEHIVDIIRDSVLTPAKHHTLVLGPRGIGKTHLLSLVHHRVGSQEDLQDRMRIAWLREEEWGVGSFLDLLHRILRTLADTYDDGSLRAETEKLFSLAAKSAERRAGELLRSFLGKQTLVVMVENLNDIFAGLGNRGQQRLRAYLQEEASWTVVATAQSLFTGVSLHDSPFYGFFEVHHLQELSVDEAAQLVRNIAELAGDEELATFVQSPHGRARIRAVHHLAGGNHRVYVILSEFLTRESLDELVDPFLKTMDDLTPYYQARMEQLSPQQRKIIDFLCDTRGAVPVKQIAQRCFITPQTASSQLKDLREKGYVRSTPIGRDSYYEVAEPLMRIALEVKKQREGPVRLFLEFLRYWYPRAELEERLKAVEPAAVFERDYLQKALEETDVTAEDPQVAACLQEFDSHSEREDWTRSLKSAERLLELRGDSTAWTLLGGALLCLERFAEAFDALTRALALDSQNTNAWSAGALALGMLGRLDEALEFTENIPPLAPGELQILRGRILGAHRDEEALTHFDQAISAEPKMTRAWRGRAKALLRLRRFAEALEAFDKLMVEESMGAEDWLDRGRALEQLGRGDEAIASFERAVANEPDGILDWIIHSEALMHLSRFEEALEALKKASGLRPDSLESHAIELILQNLSLRLTLAGRLEEALAAVQPIFQRDPSDGWVRSFVADHLNSLGRYDEALSVITSGEIDGEHGVNLRSALVRSYIGLAQTQEIRDSLDDLLRIVVSDENKQSYPIVGLIRDLYRRSPDAPESKELVSLLYELHTKHGLKLHLQAGILRAFDVLMALVVPIDVARKWVQLWKEALGADEDSAQLIHWLEALAEYHTTGDERILLSLPSEERRILESVIQSATELGDRERKLSSPAAGAGNLSQA